MQVRRGSAALSAVALISIVVMTWGAGATGARAAAGLSGVARDALGQALAGVEVLVLPDGQPGAVIATGITDPQGRYTIGALPGGAYRVAGLKSGYLAALERIDTGMKATLDLVLRPAPAPGEPGFENVSRDLSWVLRLPPKSVLKDLRPEDILKTEARRSAPPPAADLEDLVAESAVQGQVQHLVALGGFSASAGGRPVVGGETSMSLSSPLGGRGAISLAGRRESMAADRLVSLGDASGHRDDSSLQFDFSYDTSRDTTVDVKASFAQRQARFMGPEGDLGPAEREGQRAWRYDASYRKQIDGGSSVAVQVGYLDAAVDVPTSYLDGGTIGALGTVSRSLSNRAVGATGSYEVLAGDGHQVRVDLSARMLDLALPGVSAGGETEFFGLPSAVGWSIRLDGEDSWSVSAPLTLVYGLGIHQALEGRDATLVVPRFGTVWSAGPVTLHATLAYHEAVRWGSRTGPYLETDVEPFRPERPLGWETGFEARLPAGFRLKGRQIYRPVVDSWRGQDDEWSGQWAPFVAGGRAADRHEVVSFERQSPRAATFLEVTQGTATGVIAQAVAFDLPVQLLADREVKYNSGRIGVRVAPTGTSMTLEYRRSADAASAGVEGDVPLVSAYYEMTLAQDLARVGRLGAACRLVLSMRVAPVGVSGSDTSLQAERTRTLAALNHRISAGVLVSF